MRSKRYIADMVLYRLKGEYPETTTNIDPRDVFAATEDLININLKAQHFTSTMAAGETIPDGLILATYEDIPIVSYGNKRAKARLPVMPVSLPRNMGIAEVSTDADFTCLLIPLQPGQYHLLQSQGSLSDLMNQVAYEPYGADVILTKDVTAENRTKLYVRLVVSDVTRLSEYEPLPIPADMAGIIIEQLIKQFAPSPVETKAADTYTNTK